MPHTRSKSEKSAGRTGQQGCSHLPEQHTPSWKPGIMVCTGCGAWQHERYVRRGETGHDSREDERKAQFERQQEEARRQHSQNFRARTLDECATRVHLKLTRLGGSPGKAGERAAKAYAKQTAHLEQMEAILTRLALLNKWHQVPEVLEGISSTAAVEYLLGHEEYPKQYKSTTDAMLANAGIDEGNYAERRAAMLLLGAGPRGDHAEMARDVARALNREGAERGE